ncbi:hypothetical protein M9458_031397, partial [Cirrhinus mrigala]
SVCNCRQDGEGSMTALVVGIHIGMACIIFCALFLMFGYRHSFFCQKGSQGDWSLSAGQSVSQRDAAAKDASIRAANAIELTTQ